MPLLFRLATSALLAWAWAVPSVRAALVVGNTFASDLQALSATVGSSVAGQGGEATTGTIYFGTSNGGTDPASWDDSIELGVQFGVARTSLTGLTENTQYFFRAFASNAGGSSWAPETATFTTPSLAPPAVVNLPGNSLTGNSAVLRGEVLDTGHDPPQITIHYGTANGDTDPEAWANSAELGRESGNFSVFVGGLDPQTVYHYRAFGSNAGGTAWAPTTASFTTTDHVLPPVVINEVQYDEDDKTVHAEFIELHNTTSERLDLSGWRLSSAVDYRFPAGTWIDPGGFLVIGEKPSTVSSKWNVTALGPWTGKLNNDGETIRLRDKNDAVVDEVDYKLGFPWPTVGAPPSYSIELINPGLENDLGGSWRASTGGSGDEEGTLIAGGSHWKFFKGTSEPSATPGAWRQIGFDDSGWAAGEGAIGSGQGFVSTELEDMIGNYSTIYFRKAFQVADPAAIGSLLLRARADDGFNAWINGIHIANLNVSGSELPFDSTAQGTSTTSSFVDHALPNGGGLLVEGENVLAVQLLNTAAADADAFFDALLLTNVAVAQGPTPGFPNSVFATNAPPQIRRVHHAPQQPGTGEEVLISALITDPDGVASATLHYQVVRAGGYIRLTDPNYGTAWTELPMNDFGTDGDALAGDNNWSAQVPGTRHRNLVRYRITVSDPLGNSVRVPYADDLQPNFAYFHYDGVPDWTGALRVGTTPKVTYPSGTLTKVPVYHMLALESDVLGCMYDDPAGTASTYRYYATVVYDGEVYDHIKFRVKGQASTRATGKNKIKWNFNRGHRFQVRDNYGREYPTRWDKFALQTGTCPWWGSNVSTGGMVLNEQGSYMIYRLLGVPSCNTHMFHLRIIDGSRESSSTNQFEGDFWGLYIALEEPDGRFLDEMNLPDGNLYKMNGTPNKRNQGPNQRSGTSDVNSFISSKNSANSLSWWQRTVNLTSYYNYKIGTTLINNTDLRSEWNCLYYFRPGVVGDPNSRRWEMFPWDLDLTWESKPHIRPESAWENWQRVLVYPGAEREFENRAREVWDLMCSSGEGAKVVEEMKRFLDGDGLTRIVEANQALWDYHPRKTKPGIWYKNNPHLPAAEQNWEGLIQYMKELVSPGGYGANRLLNEKAASGDPVPNKPAIRPIGDPGFPADDLRFDTSNFSGDGSFAGLEWRLAEITDPESPNFDPTEPWVYEIDAVWESGELTSIDDIITIPPVAARAGHTYRARVRHLSSSGQWSHWSDPVEFVATAPDITLFSQNLMVTELMYNPTPATAVELAAGYETSDFEYAEVKNIGAIALDLADVRFTKGVDFDFGTGAITALDPGEIALVVRNEAAFERRYGAGHPVAGGYAPDNLSNGGENVRLSFGAGVAIQEFHYLDEAPWPTAPDGLGFSLVLIDPDSGPDHSLPENWCASGSAGGSPGADEATITLAAWKTDNFTAAELANPLISGDSADFELDGLVTLLEYALMADPKVFDPEHLPVLATVQDGGNEFLALGFRRRPGAGDLRYEIESSGNLLDWSLAAGVVLAESVLNEDGSVSETYRLPTVLQGAVQAFLRLRVTVK